MYNSITLLIKGITLNFKDFTLEYFGKLHSLLNNVNLDEFEKICNHIKKMNHSNSRVFIIGNGGSASTASHMANDLGTGLKRRDILTLDVVSLCDNSSISTALANDIEFKNIFYMQLKDIIKPEDTLIAISCSGNSENIIKAVEYSKERKATIIGLSGFSGGKLKDLSDINIHFETSNSEYGLVEDAHMIINHVLFSYFCKEFQCQNNL